MKAADAKTSRRAQYGGIYSYLSPVDEMWKLICPEMRNIVPGSRMSKRERASKLKSEHLGRGKGRGGLVAA